MQASGNKFKKFETLSLYYFNLRLRISIDGTTRLVTLLFFLFDVSEED